MATTSSALLQTTSRSLSDVASPLNSARSTLSSRAAARRIGMEAHGVHVLQAKRAALARLAAEEAEEEATTARELEAFDDRLVACLSARPKLAQPGRRSLPWTPPQLAGYDEAAMSQLKERAFDPAA